MAAIKLFRIVKENTVAPMTFPSSKQRGSQFEAAPARLSPSPIALRLGLAATLGAVLTLAGCHKTAEKTEDIRPVRALVVQSSDVDVQAEFAGEVRPRVESRLGFRVGGKIVARKVDAGAMVKKGQVLMQLDPQDLQLSQTAAQAGLRGAETARDFAKAELKRYQDLKAQNFVSQTILDGKEAAYKSAQANVEAAQASFHGQSNAATYASLLSDTEGVVTGVDAEVGQVVAPGTPVVRVAQSGEKEIVIGIPEDKVDIMRAMADVQVRLWASPQNVLPGKVREVSPSADPVTRTYAVKVTIPATMADAKLGMTAYVQFASKSAEPYIKVPLSALFYERGATSVWVIENGAVRMVQVTPGGVSGNEMVLKSGIKAGQTVVTAGVNQLKPGQRIKLLGAEMSAPATPAAKPAAAAAASAASAGASK